MDEPLHYIDKLFKKAVETHPELPSRQVWESLEKSLQKRNVTSIKKKYIKWRWVAAALFIFSAGLAMYTVQLVVKYKKAVEIKAVGGYLSASKRTSSNTTITATDNAKSELQPIKVHQEISPKTGNKETGMERNGFKKSAATNTDNKKAAKGTASSTTGTEVRQEKNRVVANRVRKNKSPMSSINMMIRGKDKNNGGIKQNFLNQESTNARQKAIAGSNIETGVGATNVNNTISPLLPFPINEKQDSKVFAYSAQAEIINKNTDFSIGTAQIPDNFFKNQLALTTLNVITSPATPETINGYNKNNVGAVNATLSRGKYTAVIYYSQRFVYNNLVSNNPDFKEDNYLQIKNSEKKSVANTVGFSIERNIGGNFGIESGVSLQTLITDIAAKPLVARKDNNGKINYRISTSSGYAYYSVKTRPNPVLADTIHAVSSKTTLKYISLPFGLQYHFYIGKRVTFNSAILLSSNFLTNSKITTVQSLEHTYTGELEGLKRHFFDGIVRSDVCYFLTRKVGISVTPSFSFGLSDATETRPVVTRHNSFGLAAGLNFKF